MPPRQLHYPCAGCKLGTWLAIDSSDKSVYCTYAIQSQSIPRHSTDERCGVQPPNLPILQGTALCRLRWFNRSLSQGTMKTVLWFSPEQMTHRPSLDKPLETEENAICFCSNTWTPFVHAKFRSRNHSWRGIHANKMLCTTWKNYL